MSSGILLLLDDVIALTKNVSIYSSKIGSSSILTFKKVSGVVIDDIAVTSKYLSKISPSSEIPTILRIIKFSLINKILIILPIILLFSYFIPQLILPILVLGAFYLLFEGGEKILEWLGYHKESYSKLKINKMNNENKKIKGAIKTDFVLSAEIMSIASNENLNSPIIDQFLILLLISVLLTVVVYGLVFLIVRSDDFAIYLIEEQKSLILQRFGLFLIKIIPYLLKLLSIIGTFAMIFIGGEIIFNAIQNYFQIYLVNLNLFFKFGVVPIYLCVGLILSIITNLVFFLVRRLNFF